MLDVKLTVDEVRRIIFLPQNERRTVWTASWLLRLQYKVRANTLGGKAAERFKPVRLRAVHCLRELWQQGVIYRQETTDDVGGWDEESYVRPKDARGSYFVACLRCGEAKLSVNGPRGRILEACPNCGLAEESNLENRLSNGP
jgi:hypothetical protein